MQNMNTILRTYQQYYLWHYETCEDMYRSDSVVWKEK